jgi:hypothetical protein
MIPPTVLIRYKYVKTISANKIRFDVSVFIILSVGKMCSDSKNNASKWPELYQIVIIFEGSEVFEISYRQGFAAKYITSLWDVNVRSEVFI